MICSTCKKEKPLSEFSWRKDRQEYRKQCKECRKTKAAEWVSNNRERSNATKRRWDENNKEKSLKAKREYKVNNPEKVKAYNKEYNRNYWHRTLKHDKLRKHKMYLRVRINNYLKSKTTNRDSEISQIIGLSATEFHQYIEKQFKKGMNWLNKGLWEIDHKEPLSRAKSIEELNDLCHYSNLQVLWKEENASKARKEIVK